MIKMVKVTLFGPNLNDQTKGEIHVHAAGCGHAKHYGPDTKYGGDDKGWTISASSRFDCTQREYARYADHLGDAGLTLDDPEGVKIIEDWTSSLYFAPCLKDLPDSTAAKPS